MPVINKTTLQTKIIIGVQADVVVKFAYQRNGFEYDLGYNFWGQSKETIKHRDCFEENTFALKGDAQIYGFDGTNAAVALNATQKKATIRGGQGDENSDFTNANADNATQAFDSTPTVLQQLSTAVVDGTMDTIELGIAQQQVQTSNPTCLLKDSNIDECSALLPHAISHKLFTHINYIWENDSDIIPSLGVGLFVEWACSCFESNSAHSQWGMWLKASVAY